VLVADAPRCAVASAIAQLGKASRPRPAPHGGTEPGMERLTERSFAYMISRGRQQFKVQEVISDVGRRYLVSAIFSQEENLSHA
jgi:hypothetical protein